MHRRHPQEDRSIVYLARRGSLDNIGRTTRWRLRIHGLEHQAQQIDRQKVRMVLRHTIETEDSDACERALHQRFAHARHTYGQEWFQLTEREVAEICAMRGASDALDSTVGWDGVE